ncbi:MAG: hypothetical protein ACREMJ_04960 [Gemmatimonadales bacterium]
MIGRRIAPLLLAGAVAACSASQRGGGAGQGSSANVGARDIDAVLAAHADSLLALPGVVGTAVALCDGERCIKVLLADGNPATTAGIPPRLEGYRVVVEVTGTIQPR